jgi:hypothetical protein
MMRRGFVVLVAFGMAMLALSQFAASAPAPLPAPFDDAFPPPMMVFVEERLLAAVVHAAVVMVLVGVGLGLIWSANRVFRRYWRIGGIAMLALILPGVVFQDAALAAEPDTAVSIGSLIGPWIEIAFLVLGSPIALALAGLFVRVAGMLGLTIEEARRQRLQEIIQRGLMLAAQQANSRLDGKLTMAARSTLVEEAAAYTTRYGRQTLQRLGQNPADLKAVREIVNARLAEMAPLATGTERG